MLPISLHFLVSVLTWCPPSLASCLATISAFSPLTSRPSSPPAFLASSRLTLPPSGLLPRKRPRFPRVTAPPRPAPRRPPPSPSPWPTTKTRQNLAAASACHSNCKYVHEDYCRVGTSQRTVKTCSYCKSCPKFHRKFNDWSSGASSCGPAPAVGGVKPMPAISILCCCQWKRKMGREMLRVTLVLLAYGYWRKSYM